MTYSPHDLLPAPLPSNTKYPKNYFYEKVAKHLIKDTVRIMNNGLGIDLTKVGELEEILDTQLAKVTEDLSTHPYVATYLESRYSTQVNSYKEDRKSRFKTPTDFIKPFKPGDMTHRSYFMYIYATERSIALPTELLPTGIPKWPAKLLKKFAKSSPLLTKLLNKTLPETNPTAIKAMELLAEHKADLYNAKYVEQINNPSVPYPVFNPSSSQQKQELFLSLNIDSETTSKTTGLPSYNRNEIERINKEHTDPLVTSLTQALINHSTAAIIRNNFIEAFYKYTVDGRLYGTLKLFGAKSFRLTSSNPNMLNLPSTGSIFAKPTKECFVPPEGFIVATIDYSALEDRVVANLSGDQNKLSLFTEGLDGHSLSATYYYKDRTAAIVGEFTDNKQASRDLKAIVDNHDHPLHKQAKALRQDSKPVSFGLAYGAFPPKVAATIKVPLEVAEAIFNAYHYELFPGISEYRENYVLPTCQTEGSLHLGLGCNIDTDDADKDIRTLANASIQYWSILTLLAINKLHQLIDEANMQNDILVTATIYDSIYFEVRKDPSVIKWLNDHIVPIMETDFMEAQIVPNEARLEIGPSWANLTELSDITTEVEIQTILDSL